MSEPFRSESKTANTEQNRKERPDLKVKPDGDGRIETDALPRFSIPPAVSPRPVDEDAELDNPALKNRLIRMLELALKDNRLAWELDAEGHYGQQHPEPGEAERSFQAIMMEQARNQLKPLGD